MTPISPRRMTAIVCAVVLLAAAIFLGVLWKRSHRPGVVHAQQGMEYLSVGKAVAAEQEWIDGTQEDPDDYHCYELLGDLYSQLGRYADSAACYHAASDHHKKDATLFLRWALAEQGAGDAAAALAPARIAAERLPGSAAAAALYANLLVQANRPAEAVAPLRRALKLKPGDNTVFKSLVGSEMNTADYADAESDLNQYLKTHPTDPQACFWMATVQSHKPHTPENLAAGIKFAKLAVKGLRGSSAWSLLGELYLDAGRTTEALAAYQAGRAVDPNSEAVLRGLSNCYARLGRTAELAAISRQFQEVLKRHDRIDTLSRLINADHHDITHGLELIRLMEEEGRLDIAQRYLQRMSTVAPGDPRIRTALEDLARRLSRSPSQGSSSPAGPPTGSAAPVAASVPGAAVPVSR